MSLYRYCSVTHSRLTLCDPMDCSLPGFPNLHYLPEFPQTHVHRVDDAIQPSHPLSSPSLPAFNITQHQGLFQCPYFSQFVPKKQAFLLLVAFLRTMFDTQKSFKNF